MVEINLSAGAAAAGGDHPKKRCWWPYGIVLLIGLSMAADIWVCVIAASHPSLAAEANYYQKSLVWDQQVAREQAFQRAGWQVRLEALSVEASHQDGVDRGQRNLRLTLSDSKGGAVPGVELQLGMFQSRRPENRHQLSLAEVAPGLYQARVPALKAGLWPYALTVQRSRGEGEAETLLHRGDFWVTR